MAPSSADIDAWEELGNREWSWNKLAPYYQKFYTLATPSPKVHKHLQLGWVDEKLQGASGPIQASFLSIEDPLSQVWVDTFRQLGYVLQRGPFSGKQLGAYSCPATVHPDTRERSYAASALYAPVSNRSNLHLMTCTTVEKVTLEEIDQSFIATGVQFSHEGSNKTVKARKEVIIAAGTFQSAKLLELSGIGAQHVLEKCNIPTLINNPHVGENLQDHVMAGISFEVKDEIKTGDDLLRQSPEAVQAAMTAYQTNQTGPFCTSGVNPYAVLPVMELASKEGQRQLERLLDEHLGNDPVSEHHPIHKPRSAITRSMFEDPNLGSVAYFTFPSQSNIATSMELVPITANPQAGNFITIMASLLHPFSTGSVHIASSDPTRAPTIDPKYFSHPLDLEILARHLQYIETIATTEPLASLLKPNGKRNAPKAYVKDLDAAKEYAQLAGMSNYHCVGSCAMLPQEKGGVVSERLVVYGTKNLRVVDASVMPIIPQSNTMSTVYAVAERAADLIKADHV